MWRGWVLTKPSSRMTQAGCPITQLSSDTIYLERASDPKGWGLSPTRLPPPASHKITPKWSPDWIRVPGTNSLGSINLLEWVAELREIFYLLDDQFIIKEYNSGTGRWKRCLGQGMGKECGVSVLSWSSETLPESTGVCQPRSPLTLILWGFYGGFITCTRLIKSLITADWIQCPLLPRRWGWDWNFQTSNQMFSSAVTQPPSLGSSHVTWLS